MPTEPTNAPNAPTDAAADPTGGRLVGGRYRLEGRLGRGGMGIVWAARDELLNRAVAVKEVIPPSSVDDAEREAIRERTMREARAAGRISSDGAVTIFDVVEEDGRPWIVMELLHPRTLQDDLNERGHLPPQEAAQIGVAILDALTAAHAAGVLHRDVKPGNVMFREHGDQRRAVLGDFGIAHFDGDSTLTSTGMVMGSPAYVAPERAHGSDATAASDLWSLGATLWAAVEGRSPFHRDNALATLTAVITEEAPPPVNAGPLRPVLEGLLLRDPAERLDASAARRLLLEASGASTEETPAPATASTRPIPIATPDAPPHPPHPPAPVPHQTEPDADGHDRASRRPWALAALAAVIVAAVVALALVLQPGAEDGDPGSDAAPSVTEPGPADTGAGSGAEDSGDGSPTEGGASPAPGTTPAPTTGQEGQGGDASGQVPAGYVLHTDETGFAVAVPQGWTAERDGPRVRFEDPTSSAYLMVDQTDTPAGDPVADWQRQEQSVSQRLDNYERIGEIEGIEFRGWDGADWQFVFGEDQGTRVLNRNLVTAPDQAYALYWSVPASQWDERRPVFDQIAASFQPG